MSKKTSKVKAVLSILLLSVVTCFGIMLQDSEVQAASYTANTDMLSVKCQLPKTASSTDTTTKIRIVSSVSAEDPELLSNVGFEIKFMADATQGEAEVNILDVNNTVYGEITLASTDTTGISYEFTPRVFDIDSEYFSTCTVSGIPNAYFDNGILIKPFVVVRGGDANNTNHRIYGESRYIKINDALDTNNKILSVPVLGTVSENPSVQLGGAACTLSEVYYDGAYSHIRIKQDSTALASVTKITVDGTKEASYRNLYSKVQNDTSWHTDGRGGAIVTVGDLYGFSKLSASDTFSGERIYLAANIDVNPTWTASSSPTAPSLTWTPIGDFGTYSFAGTFDGDDRTIKGLYQVSTGYGVGFFKSCQAGSVIKNFTLTNSYFESTNASYGIIGSIAGRAVGTYENIKSDAFVKSAAEQAGGLVAQTNGAVIIKNCEYSGTLTSNGKFSGGVVGGANHAVTITGSVCSGTITDSANNVGGLIGQSSTTLNIQDSKFSGNIQAGNYAGGFIGTATNGATIQTCEAGGTMTFTGSYTGGFAGFVDNAPTTITDSICSGTITASADNAGGFVGYTNTSVINIQDSKFSGNIQAVGYAGGFLGATKKSATIQTCEAGGTMTFTGVNAGGFTGYVETGLIVLDECLFSGTMTAKDISGGFIGFIKNSTQDNSIKHCLFASTASMTASGNQKGGFLGCLYNGNVTIDDSLLVGTPSFTGDWSGVVIGRCGSTSTATITDVFAKTIASVSKTVGIDGTAVTLTDYTVCYGDTTLKNVNGYRWTSLDFSNYWKAIRNSYPELQAFSTKAALPAAMLTGARFSWDWYTTVNNTDATADTYNISCAGELMAFNMLSKKDSFTGDTVNVTADIALDTLTGAGLTWSPIGNSSYPFSGTFNGNNHSITGATISTAAHYNGFFSYTNNATIKNLALEEGSFALYSYGGGLIGIATGDTNIENVYVDIDITSAGFAVGGFIGAHQSGSLNISNSWNAGNITQTYTGGNSNVGGFVGELGGDADTTGSATFTSCLNSGTVTAYANFVGGFFGRSHRVTYVTDCLNTGAVTSTNTAAIYPGSAYGILFNTTSFASSYALNHGYSLSHKSLSEIVRNGIIYGYDSAQLTGGQAYLNTCLDDSKWNFVDGGLPELHQFSTKAEGTKPALRYDISWYGDGTASSFILYDKHDLYGFTKLSKSTDFAGKTVYLGSSITVNTGTASSWASSAPSLYWDPIGTFGYPFAGTFDGMDYTISGLYRKSTDMGVALFTATADDSVVKNLRITNSYFHYNGLNLQDDGYLHPGYAASIAGWGNGCFQNIYSDATIVSEGCVTGGIVAAVNKYTGTDYNHGLYRCWFAGTVTLKKPANAANDRKQLPFYAGGLLGAVSNTSVVAWITDCLNTGTVSGSANHYGGLCGYVSDAGTLKIQRSLNVGTVKGDLSSSGAVCSIVGLVEGEIKSWMDQRSSLWTSNVYSLKGAAPNNTFDDDYTLNTHGLASDKSTYITGTGVTVLTKSQLTGSNAATNTVLLESSNWKEVSGGTPVLNQTWK